MGTLQNARCPKCKKEAHGRAEVEEKFGLRNNGGRIMVQSWCKECR